jgi:hypothetical protein
MVFAEPVPTVALDRNRGKAQRGTLSRAWWPECFEIRFEVERGDPQFGGG